MWCCKRAARLYVFLLAPGYVESGEFFKPNLIKMTNEQLKFKIRSIRLLPKEKQPAALERLKTQFITLIAAGTYTRFSFLRKQATALMHACPPAAYKAELPPFAQAKQDLIKKYFDRFAQVGSLSLFLSRLQPGTPGAQAFTYLTVERTVGLVHKNVKGYTPTGLQFHGYHHEHNKKVVDALNKTLWGLNELEAFEITLSSLKSI